MSQRQPRRGGAGQLTASWRGGVEFAVATGCQKAGLESRGFRLLGGFSGGSSEK